MLLKITLCVNIEKRFTYILRYITNCRKKLFIVYKVGKIYVKNLICFLHIHKFLSILSIFTSFVSKMEHFNNGLKCFSIIIISLSIYTRKVSGKNTRKFIIMRLSIITVT